MILTDITIDDFKCFVGEHKVKLPNGPGMILVRGENEDQPRLGANGVGKSSLFDAITWCLYGKSARGLKASAVAPWGGGKPSVAMRLDNDSAILRSAKPSEVKHQGVDAHGKPFCRVVDQDYVDSLIGMDYTTWLHTCLMSQFGDVFFDLGSTAKLDLLTEVLDLQVWIDAAAAAKDKAKEYKQHASAALSDFVREEGAYYERCLAAHQAADFLEAFDEPPPAPDPATNADELLKEAERLSNVASKAREQVNQVERRLVPLDKAIRELDKEIARLQGERAACNRDITSFREQYKNTKSLKGKCRVCKRSIDAHTREAIKEDLKLQAEWIKAEREKIDKLISERAEERDALQADLTKADVLISEKRKEYHTSADEAVDLRRKASQYAEEHRAYLEHEIALEGAGHSAVKAIRRAQCSRRAMFGHQQVEKIHRGMATACEYWQDKFKHVRLWVVDRALAQLEMEINSALITLGLEGWAVNLHVERETQSKSISKGFHVSIRSPHNDRDVPWEAWSGGETQRLRIAGAAGMAALMSDRLGIEVPIEVWDEPTAHLSGEGVGDVLRFLRSRADSGRQVWIIDHRSLDAGEFNHVVTITKTPETSTLTTE